LILRGTGDERTDADGAYVDEEVSPGVGVGRVDVEHGYRSPSVVVRCLASLGRG
jgi:hypothetical protein